MRDLQYYINLLGLNERDKAILVYGGQYHLWLNEKYLGIAIWTEDEVLGDSFQNQLMVDGELLQMIYVADAWTLVIKNRKQKPTN